MSFISSLSLTNFRNYETAQLETQSQFNVLTGRNGAGKTNILEALSFLMPGRGMRGAVLSEVDGLSLNPVFSPAWVVAAEVEKDGDLIQIGTGRDAEAMGEKRLVKIHGKAAKSHHELSSYVSLIWLTPAMDGLFRESEGTRRRFIDRLAYSRFPKHAHHCSAYEKQMRERNRLLKDHVRDAAWYEALEHSMAHHAAPILTARHQLIEDLNVHMGSLEKAFPKGQLQLIGEADDLFREDEDLIEIAYQSMLAAQREIDMRAGRTLTGLHASQLQVMYGEKNMPANHCSTGEQKALLLSILLAHCLAQSESIGFSPMLLLDEVVAHLDSERRSLLFKTLEAMGAQVWMTGTDMADFSAVPSGAKFFHVEDGKITSKNA